MNQTPGSFTLASLKADREALQVSWSDGAVHRIPWKTLRDRCPCATCRLKRAEPPKPPAPAPLFNILKVEEVQPIRATAMTPVGNYAYQISFSDGHNSGIYTLEWLREIGTNETPQ
jgi:DUF971 family protein